MATEPLRHGVVVTFDGHVGLGTVRDDTDGRTYGFHCTQIADGTRSIDVGATVAFVVRAAPVGRWEAFELTRT